METVAKLKTQLADFIGPYQNQNYCQKTAIFSDKGFILVVTGGIPFKKQFQQPLTTSGHPMHFLCPFSLIGIVKSGLIILICGGA